MDKIWKESWANYGVKGYLILIADQQGGPPNEAACKKYREDYQLGLTLLYDPTGATAQYGGMETTYVLDSDAKLTYVQQGDWMAGLQSELEKVLGVEME